MSAIGMLGNAVMNRNATMASSTARRQDERRKDAAGLSEQSGCCHPADDQHDREAIADGDDLAGGQILGDNLDQRVIGHEAGHRRHHGNDAAAVVGGRCSWQREGHSGSPVGGRGRVSRSGATG